VMYSYNDRTIAAVSDLSTSYVVKVGASLYNYDGTEVWSQDAMVDVFPDKVSVAFTVPQPANLSTTYFLKLSAMDRFSRVTSENFYWLSTKPDELDWSKTTGVNTPQSAYADLTALQDLPAATVKSEVSKPKPAPDGLTERAITLQNTGKPLAFMVHARLLDAAGHDVIPTLWDDNFVNLIHGESRTIRFRYRPEGPGVGYHIVVDAWNLRPARVSLP